MFFRCATRFSYLTDLLDGEAKGSVLRLIVESVEYTERFSYGTNGLVGLRGSVLGVMVLSVYRNFLF